MYLNFSDKVISFNKQLNFIGELPKDYYVMNPFLDNPETLQVMTQFYQKYYQDNNPRKFIIGINPSRHGAGITGVPFTDTKRLESVCGIKMKSARTHEISSVYMYDVIAEYGGAVSFYNDFYINSPFPLAIIKETKPGQYINANYYDDPALFNKLKGFMIESLKNHLSLGLDPNEVFVLGKKNALYLEKLNKEANLFKKLTVLEHPRFIQQYKSKEKQFYLDKYIIALRGQTEIT